MRKRIEPEDFKGVYLDEVKPEDLLVIGKKPETVKGEMSLELGIYDALWQISLECGLGLTVDIRRIKMPVDDMIKCDREDINPYEIPRKGEIYIVEPRSEFHLKKEVTVIGYLTAVKICRIINKDRESYLMS